MAQDPASAVAVLNLGTSFKLASAVAGATTIDFALAPYGGYGPVNVIFQAVGTLTALASALQVSLDGGNTFTSYVASFLAAATAVVVQSGSGTTPITPGAIFRINVTAATGPCDIWATAG